MFWKRLGYLCMLVVTSACLFGCGGTSKPVVTVTSSASTVDGGDTVTLTASVANDKNSAGVTWAASGGTLSSTTGTSVTFTAPAATTSAQTITITATSAADASVIGTITLTIPAKLAVTTSSLASGTVGTAYSVQLAASGGIPSSSSKYAWTKTGGTLPAGLSLSATGLLSGTPTEGGTFSGLIFTATDSGTPTALTASSASLTLTILKVPALAFTTISAHTYGDVPFTVSAGSASSGAISYSVTSGPATISGSTVTITGVGTVVLGASQAATSDYTAATATTSFTVGQATPTISISNIPSGAVYGGSFIPAYSYSGNGSPTESVSSSTTSVCTVTGGTVKFAVAGTCTLTASATATTDYTAATGDAQSFTVGQAPLTITASSVSVIYGAAVPTITASYIGFANGDAASSLSTAPTCSTTYTATSAAGTYPTTCSGAAAANYSISYVAGTVTVSKATPTLTVNNSATFDGNTHAATINGSVPGFVSNIKYDGSATEPTNAGTYAVTADFTPTDSTNYANLTGAVAGNFVINKGHTTITIGSVPSNAVYGGSFTATYYYAGTTDTPTVTLISREPAICLVSGLTVNLVGVGNCSLYVQAAATANYEATTSSDDSVSVGQATPTISINNIPSYPAIYGNFTPAYNYSGNGTPTVTVTSSTTSACTVSGTNNQVIFVGAGQCTLTASATATTYYTAVTGNSQSFTVGKATPTLSVTNSPVTYDGSTHAATVTGGSVAGLASNVLYNGSATVPTEAGTYVITADFTPTDTTDYSSLTNASAGNFVISPATPSLTFTTISNRVYGEAPSGDGNSFTVSASSVSSGTVTYSVTSGPASVSGNSVTLTGSGTVVLGASQAATTDYTTATTSTSFVVYSTLAISSTSPLTAGIVGSSYSQQLTATGGLGSYTWTVPSSTDVTCLTQIGLSLSSSGALSSSSTLTTSNKGTCTPNVQVTDGTRTATASLSVTVSAVTITPTTLSQGYVYQNSSYSAQLSASGGSGTYTWSLDSGSLPGGLSLNSSTGLISGTSTANGTSSGADTYTFTVKVTDANSNSTTQSYTILTYYPFVIFTGSWNSSVTVNNSYSGSLTVNGGTGSYTWTVNSVTPSDADSLTVNTSGNNTMTVSGTPTTAETVTYNVTVTDGNVTLGPTNYTITVNALANLSINVNDVPQGMVGMPYLFGNFNVSGGTSSYTITYQNAPSWASPNSNGQLVGTPTSGSEGTTTVTIKATDTNTSNYGTATFDLPVVVKTATTSTTLSRLKGQYACYINKYEDEGVTNTNNSSTYYRGGMLFAFTSNGGGTITDGEIDMNTPSMGYVDATTMGKLTGTYAVGSDNRGYLNLAAGSNGSAVLALAGGNLNSSSIFKEFAITEMDDAGTDPSGSHGGGHCYLQDTSTSLSGTQPSGGYVFGMTGEDSQGYPESMVGYVNFSGSGTITAGAQDMVDNVNVQSGSTMLGTNVTADSYGRMTMTAGPTVDQEGDMIMYLTNNTKGQVLMMSAQNHNASNGGDFLMGESRKQVTVTANEPLSGKGILYTEGTENSLSGTTFSNTYKAQVLQFTGSSTANNITINSEIHNHAGTFKKNQSDVYGQTMGYTTNATTGRTTITGANGIFFYVYNTGSAVALFADGESGSDVENMIGWIEPQTAPTTWSLSNVDTSYFMSKIDNGSYNDHTQTSILSVSSNGNLSTYAADEGGQQWASWDNGMTDNGVTMTGAVSLDATDGAYGLFDINFTEGSNTGVGSYCYAISVDSTISGAKGRLACLDPSGESPKISILQE